MANGGIAEGQAPAIVDVEVAELVEQEFQRQQGRLTLIASDNYVSGAVLNALSSAFENTTVEGYPGKRLHGPSPVADALERLAIDRACALFGAKHANVQLHSGTQANQAVFLALLEPGDTILSMSLAAGGHFSHAAADNFAGRWLNSIHYGVETQSHLLDYEELEKLAQVHRPKLIVAGSSAYPRIIDYARLSQIAQSVDALLMADIAHTAGLMATGCIPSPFPHADVVTSTTYKNLRGVRGGVILTNRADLAAQIDAAVCPGLQGVPSMSVLAAKAVTFGEALDPSFAIYNDQILANARALAQNLIEADFDVVTNGTDTPFVILDMKRAKLAAKDFVLFLDSVGIAANVVPLAGDKGGFDGASGIRLGVSAVTSRGFAEDECQQISEIVREAVTVFRNGASPRESALIRASVSELCDRFPLPRLDQLRLRTSAL